MNALIAKNLQVSDKQGEVTVDLKIDPAGADEEPIVAGKLIPGSGEKPTDYTIEFKNFGWRSGSIRVSPEGTFMTQLVAEHGEISYSIKVLDSFGTLLKLIPDRINYLRNAMFKEIPLSHSIAVARADNTVDPLFEKEMPLPLKKMRGFTLPVAVTKNDPQSAFCLPLIEGSNERADRNILIGYLVIGSEEVEREVPAGSQIDFTLSVDLSNRLTTSAYVPILDQEFERAIDVKRPQVDYDRTTKDAHAEIRHFNPRTNGR